MDETLRQDLLAWAAEDERIRSELAQDRSLYSGYHSRMQEVHLRNARQLDAVLDRDGWPGRARVGEEAAKAAWLIAQHSIAWPSFMRKCLSLLEQAAEIGEVPRWQPAYLIDRIRTLEGRQQVYGTQFDWDANGEISPYPIKDADNVDARRVAVGLRPLAPVLVERRANVARSGETPPAHSQEQQRQFEEWTRQVGWR